MQKDDDQEEEEEEEKKYGQERSSHDHESLWRVNTEEKIEDEDS